MNWRGELEDFKYYMKMERGFSENTSLAYYNDVSRFVDFLEENSKGIDAKDVSLKEIESFLQYVNIFTDKRDEDKILAASSQIRIIQSIRAFFKFMVMRDVLDKDVSQMVDVPTLPQRLPIILENEEIEKMMDSIDTSTGYGFRNYLTIEFLYATGLRVSEFVNLKLQNIRYEERYLDIIGKGNKERYVPIADKVLNDTKEYISKYRDSWDIKPQYRDYVFVSRSGNKLTRQFINKMLNQVAAVADIRKKIHPHILRHSFATELLRGGANIVAIKAMMGHASIKSTEIYMNLDKEDLRKTLQVYHPFYN